MAHIKSTNSASLNNPTLMLSEPQRVSVRSGTNGVEIKWTDPQDIVTNKPVPATWAGTVVVRKENRPPLHRWDGTLIVDSTTRNEYSENALVDNTVESNKTYYYGIFPYDTVGDYRFTKTVPVSVSKLPYMVLLDTANQFVDSMIAETNSVQYSDGSNYWHILDYKLQKTWNYYTPFYVPKVKFTKKVSNTNLIIDLETTGTFYGTSTVCVTFFRALPSSWSAAWNDTSNIIYRQFFVGNGGQIYSPYELPRKRMEISMQQINEPFYLAVETADISSTYIYYLGFDQQCDYILT